MTARVLHDAPRMPVLAALFSIREAYVVALQAQLLAGWTVTESTAGSVLAASGHALDCETWRSLERRQLFSDDKAVALMVWLVASAAGNGITSAANAGGSRC
jgi:hypothetical protein